MTCGVDASKSVAVMDDPACSFEPAGAFAGPRAGRVFKRGARGVGYYSDAAGGGAAGGGGGGRDAAMDAQRIFGNVRRLLPSSIAPKLPRFVAASPPATSAPPQQHLLGRLLGRSSISKGRSPPPPLSRSPSVPSMSPSVPSRSPSVPSPRRSPRLSQQRRPHARSPLSSSARHSEPRPHSSPSILYHASSSHGWSSRLSFASRVHPLPSGGSIPLRRRQSSGESLTLLLAVSVEKSPPRSFEHSPGPRSNRSPARPHWLHRVRS